MIQKNSLSSFLNQLDIVLNGKEMVMQVMAVASVKQSCELLLKNNLPPFLITFCYFIVVFE